MHLMQIDIVDSKYEGRKAGRKACWKEGLATSGLQMLTNSAYRRKEDYIEFSKHLGIIRTIAWARIKREKENDEQVTRQRGVNSSTQQRCRWQERPEYTLNQINDEIQLPLLNTRTILRTTFANALAGQLINKVTLRATLRMRAILTW